MGKRSNHRNKAHRQQKAKTDYGHSVNKVIQSFAATWMKFTTDKQRDTFLQWTDWIDNTVVPALKEEEDEGGDGLGAVISPVGEVVLMGHYTQFYQAVRGFRSYLTATGQVNIFDVEVAA